MAEAGEQKDPGGSSRSGGSSGSAGGLGGAGEQKNDQLLSAFMDIARSPDGPSRSVSPPAMNSSRQASSSRSSHTSPQTSPRQSPVKRPYSRVISSFGKSKKKLKLEDEESDLNKRTSAPAGTSR